MANKNYDGIKEILKCLTDDGFTPKEIMEAAKKMYKEMSESKSTWLPSVRCTVGFREDTERAALKVDKSITEYIYDAVDDSNARLEGKG